MASWLRLSLWSVCTFLSTETPHTASALEQGMLRRPAMRRYSLGNLGSPLSILLFLIPHQKVQHMLFWCDQQHCMCLQREDHLERVLPPCETPKSKQKSEQWAYMTPIKSYTKLPWQSSQSSGTVVSRRDENELPLVSLLA